MPIHTRFPEHVKNLALAALIKAKQVVTQGVDRHITAADLDEYTLKRTGEFADRQVSANNFADYLAKLDNIYKTNHWIEVADYYDLTSPSTKTNVQQFFGINNTGNPTPLVYFIRHKKRQALKRIELALWDNTTAETCVTAVMWADS